MWLGVKSLQKGSANASVSRSLSVPGRNMVIVRSVSFAAHKEHSAAESADGMLSTLTVCELHQLSALIQFHCNCYSNLSRHFQST